MDKLKGLTFLFVIISLLFITGCDKLLEPIELHVQEPQLSPSYPYFGSMSISPTTLSQGGSVFFRINALSFNNYPISVQLYICRNQPSYYNCVTSYPMVKEQGNYFNYTYTNALSGEYYVFYDVVETGGGSALGVGGLYFFVDGLPEPTISNVNAQPNPINRGNLITFSASVNDNGNTLDSTQVLVGSQTFTMTPSGNPRTVAVNSSNFAVGTHSYSVVVNYLGNTAQKTSSGNSFTVNAPPQAINISGISASPNPVTRGAIIQFNADIFSNVGSTIDRADIVFGDGAWYTMTKQAGAKQTFSINSNNFQAGLRNYTIRAFDLAGNSFTSPTQLFTVNPSNGPTISSISLNPTTINLGDNFDVNVAITLGTAPTLNSVKAFINGREFTLTKLGTTNNYKATVPSSQIGSGTYSYYIQVIDSLQNQVFSSAQSLTISGGSGTPSGDCGNSIINSGEECDLSNLNSQTCTSQGFESGVLSCSSSCTFNFDSCVDNTKPSITDIEVQESSTSATISWETNELADSKVEYGRTSEDYDKEKSKSNFVLNHSVTITGLTKGVKYYYIVVSKDRKGNERISSEKSFTTDTEDDSTNPSISSKQVSSISSDGARISVTLSEASIVTIKYGTLPRSYSFVKESSDYVTSYNVNLENLQPSTTYYYIVELEDASGNLYKSAEETFRTEAAYSSGSSNNNNDNQDAYTGTVNTNTTNNYTMYVIGGILLVLVIAAVFFMKQRKPKRTPFKPLTSIPDVKPAVQQPQVVQRQVQQQPVVRQPQEFRSAQEIRDEQRVIDGLRKITGEKK